jgi:hypothetical protein
MRFIKVVLPMFNLHEEPQKTFEILKATDAFAPLSIYCVPPSRDFDARREAMNRYGMLFKESLMDVFLYVEADEPFCWSPIIYRLPKGLRELSILPMIPLSKDSEMGPALSVHETRNLLAAYTVRGDTLRAIELRFLHLDVTAMVLGEVSRLPRLKSFLLACPRPNRGYFPIDDNEPSLEAENWRALETLHIRGYPLEIANNILQACQSTSLVAVTIQTPNGTTSSPFSVICNALAQKWAHSLEKLKFQGQSSWNDDPVVDVDCIIHAMASLVNLRTLYIDNRHIMSHLHLQHLITIGRTMLKLHTLLLVSESELTVYSSHLKLFDLVALKPLPELSVVGIEIGQIRMNTHSEDESYPNSLHMTSDSKIKTIVVFSSNYDSSALAQCSELFPRVTMIEHMHAPLVDTEQSESLSL